MLMRDDAAVELLLSTTVFVNFCVMGGESKSDG